MTVNVAIGASFQQLSNCLRFSQIARSIQGGLMIRISPIDWDTPLFKQFNDVIGLSLGGGFGECVQSLHFFTTAHRTKSNDNKCEDSVNVGTEKEIWLGLLNVKV